MTESRTVLGIIVVKKSQHRGNTIYAFFILLQTSISINDSLQKKNRYFRRDQNTNEGSSSYDFDVFVDGVDSAMKVKFMCYLLYIFSRIFTVTLFENTTQSRCIQ